MAVWLPRLLLLLGLLRPCRPFSGGAPLSACEEAAISPATYLRVTIRSRRAFKGFVLRAEDSAGSTVGSWYIPYLADTSFLSESRYLACSGRAQSAVTHSGQTTDMWVVSFQWRPDTHFSGWVQFRASVVVDYRTFWTNITSTRVWVRPDSEGGAALVAEPDTDRQLEDGDMEDMEVSESRASERSDPGDEEEGSPGSAVFPISASAVSTVSTAQLPHLADWDQEPDYHASPDIDQEDGTRRPSILMTPPLRPRNRTDTLRASQKSSTSTTPTTTISITTTTTTLSTTQVRPSSTTTTTTTTTTSFTSSSTRSSVGAVPVSGGIMVNARRKSTPRIMDPKFVFRTVTTSSTSTTTILYNRNSATSIYSHTFNLSADYHNDTKVDIMEGDGSGVTNIDKTLYSVESEDTSLATLLPTFHDLELINQTHGDLRSGLYDVLAAENATEVITIGRVTH